MGRSGVQRPSPHQEEDRLPLHVESIWMDKASQVNFISKLSLLLQSGHSLLIPRHMQNTVELQRRKVFILVEIIWGPGSKVTSALSPQKMIMYPQGAPLQNFSKSHSSWKMLHKMP